MRIKLAKKTKKYFTIMEAVIQNSFVVSKTKRGTKKKSKHTHTCHNIILNCTIFHDSFHNISFTNSLNNKLKTKIVSFRNHLISKLFDRIQVETSFFFSAINFISRRTFIFSTSLYCLCYIFFSSSLHIRTLHFLLLGFDSQSCVTMALASRNAI